MTAYASLYMSKWFVSSCMKNWMYLQSSILATFLILTVLYLHAQENIRDIILTPIQELHAEENGAVHLS